MRGWRVRRLGELEGEGVGGRGVLHGEGVGG